MDKGLERGFKSDIERTNRRLSHCTRCRDGWEEHDNSSLSLRHLQSSKEVDCVMCHRNQARSGVKRERPLLAEKIGEISPYTLSRIEEPSTLRLVCLGFFCLFVVILILVITASRIRSHFRSSMPTIFFFKQQAHILCSVSHYLCQASRKQVSLIISF